MADTRPVTTDSSGTTGGSGFDLGAFVSALASAGIDIYSLVSGSNNNAAQTAQDISNPFGPFRQQFGQPYSNAVMGQPTNLAQPVQNQAALTAGLDFGVPQLANKANTMANTNYAGALDAFLANPSSILQSPTFQASEAIGAENVSRVQGASGAGASGGRLAALQDYGISEAQKYIGQQANMLTQSAQTHIAGDQAGVSALTAATNAGLRSNQQVFDQTLAGQNLAASENQRNINNLGTAAGVNINPSQAAAISLGNQATKTNTAAGLAAAAGPIANAIQQLVNGLGGSGGLTPDVLNQINSDPSAFLQSIGIDPTDPANAELLNLFSSSGTNPLVDTAGLSGMDLSGISSGDLNLLESIFSGGGGG